MHGKFRQIVTQPLSFSNFITNQLSAFQLRLTVVMSLFIASIVLFVSVRSQVASDQILTQVLSSYLGSLIETQDRPEVLRLVESVSQDKERSVVIVEDNRIFASTRNISEMDELFQKPTEIFNFIGVELAGLNLVTHTQIAGKSSEIYAFRSIIPILIEGICTAFGFLLISISIAIYCSKRLRSEIKTALSPLSDLRDEITGIQNDELVLPLKLPITEFEEIRNSISKTKIALSSTKDALAEERAKQLSAESYKRLIHDLHTPVAALRNMVYFLGREDVAEDDRVDTIIRLPIVAGQILNQISAAKQNLENEPKALNDGDLRESIVLGIEQIKQTKDRLKDLSLNVKIPSDAVVTPHDSALMRRAIINLVENAVDASRDTINVTLEDMQDFIVIRVEDDGSGINESKVSEYLQGKARSSKADRQAFGLASVNHIVRAHGGRLIYKTSELGGANFEIRLGAS